MHTEDRLEWCPILPIKSATMDAASGTDGIVLFSEMLGSWLDRVFYARSHSAKEISCDANDVV